MTGEVLVQTLGGFALTVDGRPVTVWRAGRARAVFQYLLLHRGRTVSREQLREALWPHLGPQAAATSVKVAVHAVRRALGGPARSGLIASTERGYQLNGEQVTADLFLFEAAVAGAADAARAGDPARSAALARTALSHYGGLLLPDDDSCWLHEHREWLRSQALRAARLLCQRARDAGDDWEVIQWSRRATQIDPDDLDSYELLVAAHHRLGLRAQAVRWDGLAEQTAERLVHV